VVLDTISTLMPIGLAVSEVKNLATGSHTAVGSAGAECEALDSASNVRFFAAVDERVGRKITGKLDKFEKWRTANDAFDYWAERLQKRLEEAREGRGPALALKQKSQLVSLDDDIESRVESMVSLLSSVRDCADTSGARMRKAKEDAFKRLVAELDTARARVKPLKDRLVKAKAMLETK
jgi:hypothetical protein